MTVYKVIGKPYPIQHLAVISDVSAVLIRLKMSRNMWFPTMWHFHKCRLRRVCAASNFKWCSISSLKYIEYSNHQQRFWSDYTYAQAGLSLCWSHIPYCWKSQVPAQMERFFMFSLYLHKKKLVQRLAAMLCNVKYVKVNPGSSFKYTW